MTTQTTKDYLFRDRDLIMSVRFDEITGRISTVYFTNKEFSNLQTDDFWTQDAFDEGIHNAPKNLGSDFRNESIYHDGVLCDGIVYNPTNQFIGFYYTSDSWSGDNRYAFLTDFEEKVILHSAANLKTIH